MSSGAKVQSIEAIESFHGALAKFERRAESALETLSGELRRALDWLEHDRPAFWKEQHRLATNEVNQAKLRLEHCLMFPVAGERPACREEKAELKKSQARLEYCRAKRERIKHWNRQLQHELFEYEGRIGHFQRLLEVELPIAKAKLKQLVRRLDEYRIERPPITVDCLENSPHEAIEEDD